VQRAAAIGAAALECASTGQGLQGMLGALPRLLVGAGSVTGEEEEEEEEEALMAGSGLVPVNADPAGQAQRPATSTLPLVHARQAVALEGGGAAMVQREHALSPERVQARPDSSRRRPRVVAVAVAVVTAALGLLAPPRAAACAGVAAAAGDGPASETSAKADATTRQNRSAPRETWTGVMTGGA
jgi:hypothetical protein